MKKIFTSIFIFLFLLLFTSVTHAQQSDYEIKSDFEDRYTLLKEGFLTAPAVWMVDSLKQNVNTMDSTFSKHATLLDAALYPETYRSAMESLRREAMAAEQRLLIIESQGERLERLGSELTLYQNELAIMNTKADSLRSAINRSQASEERLSRLVAEYRKSLEVRDELIVNVVDSLLITYKGMSNERLQELSEGINSGRIPGSKNPLNLVSVMLDENIDYTASANSMLNVEDHLRMYTVQKHFSDSWDQIGGRLIETYGGNQKEDWRATIESKLKTWRMTASQKMWNSMDHYLEYSDVNLDAFDNNYSFFVALDNFIKEAQKNKEGNILPSDSYENYKQFQEFWSGKIKNEWSKMVQDSEVLTMAQISSIDEQLSGWEAASRPIHPLLLLLFVVTGISIIGFGVSMFKTRRT